MSDFIIMPVIMSGGAGSRLWPASRARGPKQLLPLVSERTMVQETALRVSGPDYTAPVFICNGAHAEDISSQMAEVDCSPLAVITEPMGRNTAPAAVVAARFGAAQAKSLGLNTLVLILPADHHVTNPEAFRQAVAAAVPAALAGRLVTFGIAASAPETGYGYIERGEKIDTRAFNVSAFAEKPDLETAKAYVSSGKFDWNAGIFLFAPQVFLGEMERFEPETLRIATAALDKARVTGIRRDLDAEIFASCPAESIDYAVMEKTDKAAVVPCDIGWNDIGSFSALHAVLKDEQGLSMPEGTIAINASDCIVQSDGPMVALVGVSGLGVIVKDGVVMVVALEHSQDVKKVVDTLKSQGRTELL